MIVLIVNSILLGLGLAMDVLSVSVANGLNEPHMRGSKVGIIAGTFAVFHAVMPMIGWAVIHFFSSTFIVINKFIPFVAFILLAIIGGKMILESLPKPGGQEEEKVSLVTPKVLLAQSFAISIDALSVGFTIPEYSLLHAIATSLIIGSVTLVVCIIGLVFGKKLGMKFASKAGVIGGCVLFAIGLKSLISGVLALI